MEFQPMMRKYAAQIVKWRYEQPYHFYNMDEEDVEELMNGSYYALFEKQQLIGFCCSGVSAQVPTDQSVHAYVKEAIDIGLGMPPLRTGNGQGRAFCEAVRTFFMRANMPLRLTVATFNARASALCRSKLLHAATRRL